MNHIFQAFDEFARNDVARGLTLQQSIDGLVRQAPGLATDEIFGKVYPICFLQATARTRRDESKEVKTETE